MDRISQGLIETVRQEVMDYNHVRAWKANSYYLEDREKQVFTILDVPHADHPFVNRPEIVILARVMGDKVVIDQDITDRPLYETLVQAGIPREQIILAYAGETVPEEKDAQEQ